VKQGTLFLGAFMLSVGIQITMPSNASTSGPGLYEGSLRPCPDKPNCVSSESGEPSAVAPFSFSGHPEEAWARLKTSIEELGGTIREDTGLYLWATFTSRIFRFVDDVEFRLAPDDGLLHVRSASRVGYSDLGVNRRRVEKLQTAFGRNADRHQGGNAAP